LTRYELIILGGGITGSFAGYIAGKNGLKVAVIEECISPNGATARSGGVITRMLDDLEDSLLALKTINLINEVTKDIDMFIYKGYLCIEGIDEAEGDLRKFRRVIPDIKILYPDEIRDRWSYIKLYEDEVGLYSESDFTIDPEAFLAYLWKKLGDVSVDLKLNCKATRLIIESGVVKGVEVHSGEVLHADNILVCMGAWTKAFLKKHKIKVKTFLLSVPIFKFKVDSSELVGLWDEECYSYWRPGDYTLIGGGYEAYRITTPEEGFLKPRVESREFIIRLFLYRYSFKKWKIVDSWCGPISLSYTYRPVATRINKVEGLYVIDGLGGYGLVRGPALAKKIVDEISGVSSDEFNINVD